MTCYHPLVARKSVRKISLDGKYLVKVLSKDHVYTELAGNDWYKGNEYEYINLPCGRCIGCRIDRARDWATRVYCESLYSKDNWFVTLTYDEEHFPGYNLYLDHVRQFIKDLRNWFSYRGHSGIRYFGCAEYGDASARPHFHLILFNVPLADIKPSGARRGNLYFSSDVITELWGKGNCIIGAVTLQSSRYVAKYCLKKRGTADYDELGINAPCIFASNRPGIGYDYLYDHAQEIFENGFIEIDGKPVPVPKYFLKQLDKLGYDMDSYTKRNIKRYEENMNTMIYLGLDLRECLTGKEREEIASNKLRGEL